MSAKDLMTAGVAAWNGRPRRLRGVRRGLRPDRARRGREGLRAALAEDGEPPAEEGLLTGTSTGPLPMPDGAEIPATGAAIELPYVAMHVVREGRFVESRYYWDQMATLGQLGLLSPSQTRRSALQLDRTALSSNGVGRKCRSDVREAA
jgi:ketosteroid isomerase-like protein